MTRPTLMPLWVVMRGAPNWALVFWESITANWEDITNNWDG